MPKLSGVLDGIPKLPAFPGDLNDTKNWGFTVYRTYYSPSSDENWDKLLTAAKMEAMSGAIMKMLLCGRKIRRIWMSRSGTARFRQDERMLNSD